MSSPFKDESTESTEKTESTESTESTVYSLAGLGAYSGERTSPLLANAIWSTQAELTRGSTGIGDPDIALYRLDDDQAFARWSPDVRARLYEFALVSDLYF